MRASGAIDRAIAAGKGSASAKADADAAHAVALQELVADAYATPNDVAALENNHLALVGPWTNSAKWGQF